MPHAPLGIFNVPFVAGDDVNMDMENALPGRWSNIDTDVVAIRIEFLVNEFFFLLDEAHTGSHFFRRQVEKAGDVPTRDDQGVSRTRRVGITRAERKFMLYRYPTRIFAKQAWIIGVSFLFLCYFSRQPHTSFSTLYSDKQTYLRGNYRGIE